MQGFREHEPSTCRLRSAWLVAVLIDGAIVTFSVTFKFDGGIADEDVWNGSGVGRKFVWFGDVIKLRTTSRSRCTTMKSRSVRQMASGTRIWLTLWSEKPTSYALGPTQPPIQYSNSTEQCGFCPGFPQNLSPGAHKTFLSSVLCESRPTPPLLVS
jgi:hypothetical protein